ncbi:hypothetical protein HN832_00385 [archaeon]|jgi:hypothetical protein|nr:hypothetical protein [archaeon]MBT4373701.1 hypothetical protein [archaeon]MBT4531755.1 hypothetical protein [archaeon]MBT7001867.1 hypothetical protein [archaeon]MBT7281852.1 hypothetical protein [archaeon]
MKILIIGKDYPARYTALVEAVKSASKQSPPEIDQSPESYVQYLKDIRELKEEHPHLIVFDIYSWRTSLKLTGEQIRARVEKEKAELLLAQLPEAEEFCENPRRLSHKELKRLEREYLPYLNHARGN